MFININVQILNQLSITKMMWFNKNQFLAACILIYTTESLTASVFTRKENDNDGLIVELTNPVGKIRGHILKTGKGNDYFGFQDIPYAQPPVGKNRFKPPQPVETWTGILDTVSNVKFCPQADIGTEDCLVLNVYTPLKPGLNASLPVLFMIHGGAYRVGSGSLNRFNPHYFIEQEIVVVTINYRLGVLGFLTMDDENLPGNLGLKDQHLALTWTRDNIHSFNGDPNKITINGQSAGAMSVGQQWITEQNKGWIIGVISQSGSGFGTFVIQPNYKDLAAQLGRGLDTDFKSNKSEDLLDLLLQASIEDILEVQTKMDSLTIEMNWRPIIESEFNEDAILTGPLHNRILTGDFNQVPLMIGFNSEEWLFFVQDWTDEKFAMESKVYDDDARMFISEQLNAAEENREEAGLDLKALYTSTSFLKDRAAYIHYISDSIFVRSIVKQAEGASQYVPVYLYELSWNENPEKYSGIPHSVDLAYLWDAPIAITDISINETLRTAIIKLWCNFIKTQNPTPEPDEDIQNMIWPTVQPNDVKYLNLNKTFEILGNPRKYSEMKSILDKVIQPPYNVY